MAIGDALFGLSTDAARERNSLRGAAVLDGADEFVKGDGATRVRMLTHVGTNAVMGLGVGAAETELLSVVRNTEGFIKGVSGVTSNKSALRLRVEGNIAESKAARSSSRFRNYIEAESKVLNIKFGYGSSIKMDGHKIYDSKFSPLSSNPTERYRFSDPSFRDTGKDVYFGENIKTAYYEVRQNTRGKSLFVGEIQVDKMLDLTNPGIVKKMNIDVGRLTAKLGHQDQQKAIYNYTNQISNKAYLEGYNGIIYPSSRSVGNNAAVVLFGGRYDSSMIKELLNFSLKR